MKTFKKAFVLILALIMCIAAFAACGGETESVTDDSSTDPNKYFSDDDFAKAISRHLNQTATTLRLRK